MPEFKVSPSLLNKTPIPLPEFKVSPSLLNKTPIPLPEFKVSPSLLNKRPIPLHEFKVSPSLLNKRGLFLCLNSRSLHLSWIREAYFPLLGGQMTGWLLPIWDLHKGELCVRLLVNMLTAISSLTCACSIGEPVPQVGVHCASPTTNLIL